MNQIETVIEKKGLFWVMSRVKSKSPKLYRNIQAAGGIVILALGPLTLELQSGAMTIPHQNIILPICQMLVMLLAGAGITAATTTTDARLATPETKENILKEVVKNTPTPDVRTIVEAPKPIGPLENGDTLS